MPYLASQRPDYVEEIAVASTVTLAREPGCETVVVHPSSARRLTAVHRGREDGAHYWAETCPQYLLLSPQLLAGADGRLYTFTPTLKSPEDSEALCAALAGGDITYIGSDHKPFVRSVKLGAATFDAVYPGIAGTETLLPLLFSEGVGKGRLTLDELAKLTSMNAARIFQLQGKGATTPRNDADFVVIDPHKEITLSPAVLHSRRDYTPREGFPIQSYPILTISRDAVVARDGEFVGQPDRGRVVPQGTRTPQTEDVPA